MRKHIYNFRDLLIWQKAMDLVERIYRVTQGFPKEELYGMTSQIRRSAISVPSNISEGHARRSTKAYLSFLSVAYGSLAELETQLILCNRLGYLRDESSEELLSLSAEIGRMINGLINSLSSKAGQDKQNG